MQNSKKLEGIDRNLVARRVADEIPEGSYVNLGIGMPTQVSNWIKGRDIVIHAEIGMMNCGPFATGEAIEQDCVNASCQPVTEIPGTSYFSSCESLLIMRGGFLDYAVLGALQVAENGDYAGWNIPTSGRGHMGNIGGSMDLAVGAKNLFIAMEHVTNEGEYKIVEKCSYPLTAKKVVKKIFTNLAVIDVTPDGLVLREVAPGLSVKDVQSVTGPRLIVARDLKEIPVR